MIDRPRAHHLLEAMADTLADGVVPVCAGAAQHSARVVANLCRILAREVELGEANTAQTADDLASLLGADGDLEALVSQLDEALKADDPSEPGAGAEALHAVLLANAERRLDIAKPEYRSSRQP